MATMDKHTADGADIQCRCVALVTLRAQATTYDVMCAIDELLQPDFADKTAREQLLDQMFAAWLETPAFTRQGYPEQAGSLQDELRAARAATYSARQWSWSRRVAGFTINRLVIAHA